MIVRLLLVFICFGVNYLAVCQENVNKRKYVSLNMNNMEYANYHQTSLSTCPNTIMDAIASFGDKPNPFAKPTKIFSTVNVYSTNAETANELSNIIISTSSSMTPTNLLSSTITEQMIESTVLTITIDPSMKEEETLNLVTGNVEESATIEPTMTIMATNIEIYSNNSVEKTNPTTDFIASAKTVVPDAKSESIELTMTKYMGVIEPTPVQEYEETSYGYFSSVTTGNMIEINDSLLHKHTLDYGNTSADFYSTPSLPSNVSSSIRL